MTNELTEEQYLKTMTEKMVDITANAEAVVDIWDYTEQLIFEEKLDKAIVENQFVQSMYRNDSNTFDHVLLPTGENNVYVVILVDLMNEVIIGHYILNLNHKYGII